MNDAELFALVPPERSTAQTFDLGTDAREWLAPEERAWIRMPGKMSSADELAAWDQLQEWDAVAGRLLRDALLSGPEQASELRQRAEHVAAVAHQLAVRLGARF